MRYSKGNSNDIIQIVEAKLDNQFEKRKKRSV